MEKESDLQGNRTGRHCRRDAGRGAILGSAFAQLKFYRNYLASKKGVPVNRIFTDDTLSEMARKRPETKEELRAIRGIGPKKSAEYGDAFINIIKSSPQSAE